MQVTMTDTKIEIPKQTNHTIRQKYRLVGKELFGLTQVHAVIQYKEMNNNIQTGKTNNDITGQRDKHRYTMKSVLCLRHKRQLPSS